MRLLAISNPEFFPDEAEIINRLFSEGLLCLHLRKPESNEQEYRALITQISPQFLERISIHQHHQLAEEFGIKRLHFTENRRKIASEESLESLTESGFTLSTSIHGLVEMTHLSSHFSYTFFGPVFDSISKTGYKSVLTKDFSLKNKTRRIQIMALGGIDITNIDQVKKMDFDGAAILGTLWKSPQHAIKKFTDLNLKSPSQP